MEGFSTRLPPNTVFQKTELTQSELNTAQSLRKIVTVQHILSCSLKTTHYYSYRQKNYVQSDYNMPV